mmetsp:Transcript_26129/g.72041  ORF Transcript_26129/g.72041 Transcript_26129/m.72041 type:complete len:409 (+) Transcript_26129:107-1333(+)
MSSQKSIMITSEREDGDVSRKRRRENDDGDRNDSGSNKKINSTLLITAAAASLEQASMKHEESNMQPQRTQEHENAVSVATNTEDDSGMELATLSSLLSVPLEYIFREVSPASAASSSSALSQSSRRKPLLSRNEAQCFLTIATLATEFDGLTSLSSRILEERMELESFNSCLYQSGQKNLPGMFGSLYALGKVMQDDLSNQALERVGESLNHILSKLGNVLEKLRYSMDQNWTTYESLQDVDDCDEMAVNAVALEKRHLAEVQEETVRRIEGLNGGSCNILNLSSMRDFCNGIFGGESSTAAAAASTKVHSDNNATPQMRSSSQSSRVSTGSKHSPAGSETTEDTTTARGGHNFSLQTQNHENDDGDQGELRGFRSQTSSPSFETRTTNTQVAAGALSELAMMQHDI